MADDARARAKAQKATAKAVKSGKNPISGFGAKARAAANKLKAGPAAVPMTRNGPKASEKTHLQPDQFSKLPETYLGRHRAPTGATSFSAAKKNARGGSSYSGKHQGFDWFSKAA